MKADPILSLTEIKVLGKSVRIPGDTTWEVLSSTYISPLEKERTVVFTSTRALNNQFGFTNEKWKGGESFLIQDQWSSNF